jgi:hypothetical protein
MKYRLNISVTPLCEEQMQALVRSGIAHCRSTLIEKMTDAFAAAHNRARKPTERPRIIRSKDLL